MVSASLPWGSGGELRLGFQRFCTTRTHLAVRTRFERRHPTPAARATDKIEFTARANGNVKRRRRLRRGFRAGRVRRGGFGGQSHGRGQRDMGDNEKFREKIPVFF